MKPLPSFRTIITFSIVAFSLIGVSLLATAEDKVPPFEGIAWWPHDEIRDALSYIRLTPEDLALRDDYVERDAFRLPRVDSLMRDPAAMAPYLAEISINLFAEHSVRGPRPVPERLRVFYETLDRTVFAEYSESPARMAKAPRVIGNKKLRKALADWPEAWKTALPELIEALSETGWTDSVLGGLSQTDRAFVLDHAREFVLEDEADKDKSAEELDAQQQTEDDYARHFASIAENIRWRWVYERGGAVMTAVTGSLPTTAPPPVGGRKALARLRTFETSVGTIVFGTEGRDHFTGSPVLIIDPGGNDRYELTPLLPDQNRCILDYGGDDEYVAPGGSDLGSAQFGWSLLVDFEGNDSYRAGSFSLGAGWFGVGCLADLQGRDLYVGDIFTQGAGGFGVGLLFDGDRQSDQYISRLFAQGFGFSAGMGVLADAGGNDIYTAGGKYEDVLRYRDHFLSLSQGFGYGIRPHFSGGIGCLLDHDGNDLYVADIFGQGCSYWWAFGGLYDGGGNDHYVAFQYAQGSATHLTVGCLYDAAGDDRYESKGVSQGCGHDWASGVLIDADGNDRYIATDLSQAAGSANGVGLLFDRRGDDGYYIVSPKNTQGYGNPRREYGSIGLFLDLDGTDRYDGPGADGTVWIGQSKWGVGVDVNAIPADTTEQPE